jgi:hypothetical protein
MYQQLPMPMYQVSDPEWMAEADKLMSHMGREPVQWGEFSARIGEHGEMDVGAAEMRFCEDCTVPPKPDNDGVVAVVLVSWTGSMVSVLKKIGMVDWPIRHSSFALDYLYRSVPEGCHAGVLPDSYDVATGFGYCADTEVEHGDPQALAVVQGRAGGMGTVSWSQPDPAGIGSKDPRVSQREYSLLAIMK